MYVPNLKSCKFIEVSLPQLKPYTNLHTIIVDGLKKASQIFQTKTKQSNNGAK